MKKTFIIANWKSNKTESEAKDWLSKVSTFKDPTLNLSDKEIIVCPSLVDLSAMKKIIDEQILPIKLGAQDISPFDEGAYTGETNGKQIREFAQFVLIGHSERRKNFGENDEILFKKVDLAGKYGLTPIFCVQGIETKTPSNIAVVAYEPVNAIGTGHPDTAQSAEEVASFFKKTYNVQYVLYGGSVTSKNVKEFTQMISIDGVLVGGASLDAQEFYTIIQNS